MYTKYFIKTHGLEEKTIWTVEHFILYDDEKIEFVFEFMNEFLFQTDDIFNTNQLNMSLSTIIGITNTIKAFFIEYCYITWKFVKAFTFIYSLLQQIVYKDRPSLSVVLGDFNTGLSAFMKEIPKMPTEKYAINLERVIDRVISMVARNSWSWSIFYIRLAVIWMAFIEDRKKKTRKWKL